MRDLRSKRVVVLLLAALLGGGALACDDDDEPRPEIEGLFIRLGQDIVAEVPADGVAEGLLALQQDQTSDVFFIVFTDAEGIGVELTAEEFVILTIADESVATVQQVSEGSQGFQLTGLQGGVTTGLTIELARGDPSDPTTVYITPDPVPVAVTGVS